MRFTILSKSAFAGMALMLGLSSAARAQDTGRIEITGIAGGGAFFIEDTATGESGVGVYTVGGAASVRLARRLSVEGEFLYGFGPSQELVIQGLSLADTEVPQQLTYTANVIVDVGTAGSAFTPYVAGGIGGLTLLERDDVHALGLLENDTFLLTSAGGGVKWFATHRFGLRADYRVLLVPSREEASVFFGRTDARIGHRVYGGLIVRVGQ